MAFILQGMTAIYGLPSAPGKRGFQSFLDCIGKTKDGLQGNLLFLLGDSVLQLTEKCFFLPDFLHSELHWSGGGSDSAFLWQKPNSLLMQKLKGIVGAVSQGQAGGPQDQARGSKAWLEAPKA